MASEAITTLVTAAAGGAATEAGRLVWESLLSLARRATGREGPADLEPVDPQDTAAVRALAARIAEEAAADPQFAEALERWRRTHTPTTVRNEISGSAQVTGNVIQAGEIKGNITFN